MIFVTDKTSLVSFYSLCQGLLIFVMFVYQVKTVINCVGVFKRKLLKVKNLSRVKLICNLPILQDSHKWKG